MSRLILVRATVHLPGIPLGSLVAVDPEQPYIRGALRTQALVRELGETEEILGPGGSVVGLRLVDDPTDELGSEG